MCQAKTKIRLDSDDLEKLGEESLPVIVYLCPKCGKMEFVAEEKTRQKLLSKSLKP
jgi:ribosomal protein S27AE